MYLTKVRPRTEPYEFWTARRKVQQQDIKVWLRGRVFHDSSQGPYVAPLCPLCDLKNNKCRCHKLI